MIAIVNKGINGDCHEFDTFGNNVYTVQINSKVLTTFVHKRTDGLAVCLEKAG